jgi:hypothetical protein
MRLALPCPALKVQDISEVTFVIKVQDMLVKLFSPVLS